MRFSIGVQVCLRVLAHLDAAVGKSDAVLSGGGVPVAVLVLVEVDAGVVVLDGVGVVVDGRGDGLLLVGAGRGVGRGGRGVGAGLVWAGQGNGGQGEDEEDLGEEERRGLVGGWRERGSRFAGIGSVRKGEGSLLGKGGTGIRSVKGGGGRTPISPSC